MRRKLRIIKENILKVLVLPIFVLAIVWIRRHLAAPAEYIPQKYVKLAFLALLILFVIYLFYLFQSLVHSAWLRRFDPGDPESLSGLAKLRRYKLPESLAAALRNNQDEVLEKINIYLHSRGFNDNLRRSFGQIYERKLIGFDRRMRSRWQRIAVLYRPILNVIVVDQMLKEAIDYIERSSPHAKMNQYILVTDMGNNQEVLSAAAGVVNFLGSLQQSYLSPVLIDLHHGRIFFPLDRSLLSLRQKLFHDYLRYDLIFYLKRHLGQAPTRVKTIKEAGEASLKSPRTADDRMRGPELRKPENKGIRQVRHRPHRLPERRPVGSESKALRRASAPQRPRPLPAPPESPDRL